MIQVQIPDDAVYDSEGLMRLLGLRPQALRHARANGLLYAKRCKRAWYLGRDVKAWLFAGSNHAAARHAHNETEEMHP
jgi:hypothetical protein